MNIILKSGLIAAALIVGAAGAARAETLDVKVPFPFIVHGQTLPAGDCCAASTATRPPSSSPPGPRQDRIRRVTRRC